MNTFCTLAAFLGRDCSQLGSHPDVIHEKFASHVADYGLSYGTDEEYTLRLELFAAKEEKINELNAKQDSFVAAHNKYSTWTDHEFATLAGGRNQKMGAVKELEVEGVPSSVDWRALNKVTAVKNQGRCASCWAFSTTASIESAHAIKTGQLADLSEQELLDCDSGSSGCTWGIINSAFSTAEHLGLMQYGQYPYQGVKSSCRADTEAPNSVKVTNHFNVRSQSQAQFKAAIAVGPVSLTVHSEAVAFRHYSHGILDVDAHDCPISNDHCVSAVGYGTENGKFYYIIKNSWGTDWGESGFIRIAANGDGPGVCGVQQYGSYPVTE